MRTCHPSPSPYVPTPSTHLDYLFPTTVYISHIHFKADLDIVTDADLFNDFGKSHRATAIAPVRV